MDIKNNIRKILIIGFWFFLGAGVLVLLVASIKIKRHKTCQGYKINIRGSEEQMFIDQKDVQQLLSANGVLPIEGVAIRAFDLKKMEETLERNVWIKNAELFFNNEVLQVNITEIVPIARIFTVAGQSFYIDKDAERLPLSDKLSARVPVFTNYPGTREKKGRADSLLMQQIKLISLFILHDPFWMAQTAQIDITPDRNFELIPMFGNHIIEFGDGTDYEKKFNRLMIFYKHVLSRVGMDHYSRIKVQYAGQVIGVRKGNEQISKLAY